MFEWYAELPRWMKVGISLLILGAAYGVYLAGYFWPWAWGVGGVLLVAAFVIDD